LIVSLRDDLHALAVQRRIESGSDTPCEVVESDNLVDTAGFSWSLTDTDAAAGAVPTQRGTTVDLAACSVVWWRRASYPQLAVGGEGARRSDFISNEWRAALVGALVTGRPRQWISSPERSRQAANKPLQLATAARVGWLVPATLVSQDRRQVQDFCAHAPGGRVVAKSLSATFGQTMATVEVSCHEIASADVEVCPAIYQHVVRGDRHLRVNCWGEEVWAFEIRSAVLDWRRDQAAPTRPVQLTTRQREQCLALIRALGLQAGVIDAKFPTDGSDPVFLEVNPQGQFLFLEGATGVDLTGGVANFFIAKANAFNG
jgi:glutathione synthase/RimK-type ligase-like ATP-grasp enzyme